MSKEFIDELNSELKAKGLPELKTGSQVQLKIKFCSNCGKPTTVLYQKNQCRHCLTLGFQRLRLTLGRNRFL
ncbi:hypothetical protein [Leptospira stimsonii]|uniref:Uncharacterized protein n=1 Tax=Leptospira stimsonii TaxID=2202203 RepID=A0ABY2MV43_9LEPT|nr:hypothetical protein [Leptospira stimsonii]TGK25396.1 hypothetical protein EHO98_03075 [Leptospira stimsonii]TGM08815.1 hypothetical protein EHQ90_22260 [Leptospira stimsonii]